MSPVIRQALLHHPEDPPEWSKIWKKLENRKSAPLTRRRGDPAPPFTPPRPPGGPRRENANLFEGLRQIFFYTRPGKISLQTEVSRKRFCKELSACVFPLPFLISMWYIQKPPAPLDCLSQGAAGIWRTYGTTRACLNQ